MNVYLVRHGTAHDKSEDPERHLTAGGKADAKAVAEVVGKLADDVEDVFHSGKARAMETAEIFAEALSGGIERVGERDDLGPKDPVAAVEESIIRQGRSVMLVGHLPFMEKLASLMAAGDENAAVVDLPAAGALCLSRDPEKGWQIAWMVTPEVLLARS